MSRAQALLLAQAAETRSQSPKPHELDRALVNAQLSTTYAILELATTIGSHAKDLINAVEGVQQEVASIAFAMSPDENVGMVLYDNAAKDEDGSLIVPISEQDRELLRAAPMCPMCNVPVDQPAPTVKQDEHGREYFDIGVPTVSPALNRDLGFDLEQEARCDAALIGPDVEDIPCSLPADHKGLHYSVGGKIGWED